MRFRHPIIHTFLLTFIVACSAQSSDTSDLPTEFKKTIPVEMKGNLKLVEVENRCVGCEPWRYIEYHNNESDKPIKKEKVTVQVGYRAMYAYPDTEYFSNTKIEKSSNGKYEQDRNILIEAIIHEYNRKKERIVTYLNQTPSLKEKMAPYRAKGKDYITLEQETINGYEYISYTENVIGLLGNTISQIHIFVPENEIIITAYLLQQEKTKFKDIEEFLLLKSDFIESYTSFLKNKSVSK